jgi:non-specific protein-tyrosine kinase
MPSRPAPPSTTSSDEAFRILRSNLLVSLQDLERPTVLVTSAQEGEGKTVTSVRLARSLALAGKRVVLVDLDLRHPDVHRWLGVDNERGVVDVLLGKAALEDCLQYVPVDPGRDHQPRGLYVLPTGPTTSNPAELLGSRRTAQMLDALAQQADIVLLDSPPVLPVADALVIGRMVAGAVLVIETRGTTVPVIQQAKDALTRSQTRLLGVILNKVRDEDLVYGYGYGREADADSGVG